MSGFASTSERAEEAVSFDELGQGLYACAAGGDLNSGVIVGPEGVVVVDAQATPAMAAALQGRIAEVTDRKVRTIVLTHYHALRVLGATGYPYHEIICSDATRGMIAARGQQERNSAIGRYPGLFHGRDEIPGLTWPTQTFQGRMSLWLGEREAQVIHIGRSHTAGDTVVWLPREKVLFAGDTVTFGTTPECADAHFTDWPATIAALRALGAEQMLPGRGRALRDADEVKAALDGTEAFTRRLFGIAKAGVARGAPLGEVYAEAMAAMRPEFGHWLRFDHVMPFNVSRAYDEAGGLDRPRIRTAERDREILSSLAASRGIAGQGV